MLPWMGLEVNEFTSKTEILWPSTLDPPSSRWILRSDCAKARMPVIALSASARPRL